MEKAFLAMFYLTRVHSMKNCADAEVLKMDNDSSCSETTYRLLDHPHIWAILHNR